MSHLVQLDSELVNNLRILFTENSVTMGAAKFLRVEQTLLPNLQVEIKQYPGQYDFYINSEYVPLKRYELDNHDLANKVIAVILAKVIHTHLDVMDNFRDMLAGISMWNSFESPLGIEVKYHKDLDGQRLLVLEKQNPQHPIYALEEAVNTDLSVSPECMTTTSILENRLWHLFGDFIMADRVPYLVNLGELSYAD